MCNLGNKNILKKRKRQKCARASNKCVQVKLCKGVWCVTWNSATQKCTHKCNPWDHTTLDYSKRFHNIVFKIFNFPGIIRLQPRGKQITKLEIYVKQICSPANSILERTCLRRKEGEEGSLIGRIQKGHATDRTGQGRWTGPVELVALE